MNKEKVDLFRKHRTGWGRFSFEEEVGLKWCSISGETAAAKGTAGWPAQKGDQGRFLRLKRFERIFIDILTEPLGLIWEGKGECGLRYFTCTHLDVSEATSYSQLYKVLQHLEFALSTIPSHSMLHILSEEGSPSEQECRSGLITERSPSSWETLERERKGTSQLLKSTHKLSPQCVLKACMWGYGIQIMENMWL